MRASELIDTPVLDAAGNAVGVVRDLRIRRDPVVGSRADGRLRVRGVVVGRHGWVDRAAHVWGFASGRARGPWILCKLTRRASARARFAPAEQVAAWTRDGIRLKGDGKELLPLEEAGG